MIQFYKGNIIKDNHITQIPNQSNSYPQNQQNFPILPENNNIPSQNFGQGAKTSFSPISNVNKTALSKYIYYLSKGNYFTLKFFYWFFYYLLYY